MSVPTIRDDEWVSWFGPGGRAEYFPVDSERGRWIAYQLGWDVVPSKRTEQRQRKTKRDLVKTAKRHGANVETAIAQACESVSGGKWWGRCAAPKALFPRQVCGKKFLSRRGRKFCSAECRVRASRAASAASEA